MRLSRRGKRRLLVVALAAVLLGAGAVAFKSITRAQQTRMATEARQAGMVAYAAGDLPKAIAEFKYFFGHNKDDLEVNLVLAEAQSRNPMPGGRHLFEAVELYTTYGLDLINQETAAGGPTLESIAQRQQILIRLLDIYAQLGDRTRVLKTADALLADDPGRLDALAAKAEVLFLGRQFAETEAIAQRMIEIDPDSLTWRKMYLEVRSRQGDTTAQLVEQCRRWSEEYTADARFRLLTAAMLVDAGRTDDARAELRAAGDLTANSRAVLEQLTALLDAIGLSVEADAATASATSRFPGEWWPREVAIRRLWQNDDLDRAAQELATAKATLGEPPSQVRRLEVAVLMAAGRHAEALEALQPMLAISVAAKEQDDDRHWATAVATFLSTGGDDWRSVSDALEMAISTSPHDAVLQYLLGNACVRVGEQARAIAAYRQAFAAAPAWSAAGVAFGNALLQAGRVEEAHHVARVVVSRSGIERFQPFLLYARSSIALRESGMPSEMMPGGDTTPEIVSSLQQIHDQDADVPAIATLLVRAHLAVGDQAAAGAFLRNAAADDRVGVETILALTEIAREQMPDMESLLIDRARSIAGLTVPVAFAQADLLGRSGEFERGLALINQAIANTQLDDMQRQAVGCARAAYLLRMNAPSAMPTLNALVNEFADSPTVQRFALAQPQAWLNQRLVAQAMGNLHRLLGEDATQVRLAEANFLIQHHGGEPEMLARAIVAINRILEEDPDSLAALSLAADAMTRGEQPDLEQAAAHLEHAARLYPAEPSLLVRLIALLQQQGRFNVARSHLQKLAALSQLHPEVAFDELRLLTAQGDFETAMVRAAAVVNDASPPSQQLLLAAIEERTGNVPHAEEVYERLLAAHPDDVLVIMQAAEFFASTGRFERGLVLLENMPAHAAMAGGDGVMNDVLVGQLYQRHGRMNEAGALFQRAVDRNPQSPEARNELARHYLAINQPAKAKEQAMAGLLVNASHVGLRTSLAIANLSLPGADRTQAIALLREFGAENDALLAMLELLDQVPARDGRSMPTIDNLKAAQRLTDAFGLFLPVWQLAVSLHMEAGDVTNAIAIARGAISRLPGEPMPAMWATQLLMREGRWSEALAEAQEWRRRTLADPLPADAATARIFIVLDRALEALQRLAPHRAMLVAERSQFPDRLLILIEAMVRTGDIAGAESLASPLLAEDARWRDAWKSATGLMSEADAERVLRGFDDQDEPPMERLALATAWLSLAQRAGSESHLVRAEALAATLESDPETAVGAAITLGAVAEARGDLPAAEQHYRNAIRIAPANPVALNNLAFVLAQQGKADEALPLIDKALTAQPDQPDFLDTRATVLSGLSRFDDAEAALKQALIARPDDPALMLNLAEVSISLGRLDDAAITLSRVELRSASLNAQLNKRLVDLQLRIAAISETAPGDAALTPENTSIEPATTKPGVP